MPRAGFRRAQDKGFRDAPQGWVGFLEASSEKEIKAYLATGSMHQGLAAEALLAHGRTQWGGVTSDVAGACVSYRLLPNETPANAVASTTRV